MLLFYYGTDSCRMRQGIGELADRYRSKHEQTNLFLLDVSQPQGKDELERSLKHQTFFREPTFITAGGAFEDKQAATLIAELIDDTDIVSDKELVLLVHHEGDEKALKKLNASLFKTLTAKAKTCRTFEPLKGRELLTWVQSFCTERNCTLSAPSASRLIALVGENSWALNNELAKLCAWTVRGAIETTTIERLVTAPRPEANVFALTDAVASRNKRAILDSLGTQLEAGSDPHHLLTMYAFTIRNLLTVKDLSERGLSQAAIAKTGGLHPFVVKKAMSAGHTFEKQELLDAHDWLALADRATKDGLWDARDTLYDFVLSAL